MNPEPELIANEDDDPLIAQIPVGDFDAAVVLDPYDDNKGYVVEQLGGDHFNVHVMDIEGQKPSGQPARFNSLSEALQHIAEQVKE